MKKPFIILCILTGLISSASFLLIEPKLLTKQAVAACIAVGVFAVMAAWFFLTSLHAFKKQLKVAYIILAIGIALFGLTQTVLLLYLIESLAVAWLSLVLVSFYFIGMLTLYVGVWKFARLLEVKSLWRSLPLVSIVALALAAAVKLVFGNSPVLADLMGVLTFSAFIAGGVYGVAAAILATKLRRQLAPVYRSGVNWLIVGLWLAAFTAFHETIIRLVPFFGEPQFYPYFDYAINLWPFLLAAIMFLGASLAFRQLSHQFGALPENASYLEVINYAAQQVSTPTAIDVTLDQVREVTTTDNPDKLSDASKAKLVGVYKQIEDYLVTKEPLRKISRDELRLKLPDEFRQALTSYESDGKTPGRVNTAA